MSAKNKTVLSLLLAGASAAVLAGPISCPGTAATTDREFTLTTSITASCVGTGIGNVNGNNDVINALGYITVDKSDDSVSGLTPFNWSSITGGGTTGGSFSFVAPAGYSSFVIAFKSGQGQLDPDWAAFLLPAGVLSGSWTISGRQSLSHVNLYGISGPTVIQVPEPISLALFGIGLAALGFVRRRT